MAGVTPSKKKKTARKPVALKIRGAKSTSPSGGDAAAPRPATNSMSTYAVHPSVAMVEDWIRGLKAKTGRSLEEWLKFIQNEGPADEASCRVWLKDKQGMGTNTAWWLAERAHLGDKEPEDTPESYMRAAVKYVDDMYAGGRAGLIPLHDELVRVGRAVARDVKVCPCKTIVPLYREHVFAQIKPTTRTRIDLGFALARYKGKLPSRLIDTGGKAKGDRITHRIEITETSQIDADVRKWLKIAYDLDA